MTTIACTRTSIAADSCFTFDDIGIGTGQAKCKKLHRVGRSVYGERGENCTGVNLVLDWLRRGGKWKQRPIVPKGAEWNLLELSPKGIFLWSSALDRDEINEPNFAIGSGAKAALYCMRYLSMNPLKAVEEAAKVDAFTRGPFFSHSIKS